MTVRIFSSGQSNMMGRGTGGPLWATVSPLVHVWNNVNPLGDNGTAFVSAETARAGGTFENTDRNNLAVWFAHRVAQIRDEDVNLTMVARGATKIGGWEPGGTPPMLQECIDVWSATGQEPAHIFLWHQGEGDVADPPESYKAAFLDLVSNLKVNGVIDDNTVIILGGLAEDNQDRINFNNNVLLALAEENTNIFYAVSSGLSTFDGTHFSGPSLYTHGAERYFAAYAEAEGFAMADLFALVNEGGTPGSAGTGTNKLYNLLNLALIGMGKKDITLSPDFTGTPPPDNLLTAAMLAAGAPVEYGTDATNGTYIRWESGIQVCFNSMVLEYQNASLLVKTWTFPKPFINSWVNVTATPNISLASNNFTGAKRGGSLLTTNAFGDGDAGNIRMESNGLYTSGDETCGVTAIAIGFWK